MLADELLKSQSQGLAGAFIAVSDLSPGVDPEDGDAAFVDLSLCQLELSRRSFALGDVLDGSDGADGTARGSFTFEEGS